MPAKKQVAAKKQVPVALPCLMEPEAKEQVPVAVPCGMDLEPDWAPEEPEYKTPPKLPQKQQTHPTPPKLPQKRQTHPTPPQKRQRRDNTINKVPAPEPTPQHMRRVLEAKKKILAHPMLANLPATPPRSNRKAVFTRQAWDATNGGGLEVPPPS